MPPTPQATRRDSTNGRKARSLAAGRPVLYPEYKAKWCVGPKALTQAQIDDMLGWREETPEQPFGDEYLFIWNGRKVRCLNNVRNRPIYWSVVRALVQEHLHGKWQVNGEPVILGQTGMILNGQHTLIAAKVAEWERIHGEQTAYWRSIRSSPIVLEKLVVVGVLETDEVVNTMDTCKPRSLADVIYRSPYFRDEKPKDRKLLARTLDYTIAFLWDRTGARHDAYAPRRTHAEALDFLGRHPQVEACVKHVWEEYKADWTACQQRVPASIAAGCLYLMATSSTPPGNVQFYQEHVKAGDATEAQLWLDLMTEAKDFWTAFRAGAPELEALVEALAKLRDPAQEGGNTKEEKVALVAIAWATLRAGQPLKLANLSLKYRSNAQGTQGGLAMTYGFGGIDRGNRLGVDLGEDGEPDPDDGDDSPEAMQRRRDQLDQEKGRDYRIAERRKAPSQPQRTQAQEEQRQKEIAEMKAKLKEQVVKRQPPVPHAQAAKVAPTTRKPPTPRAKGS